MGVILSGLQEDGSLGMAAIAGRGGVTIVQDPEEARFGAMPRATLSAARVDYILPVEAIAPLLARLARPAPAWEGAPEMAEDTIEDERPAEIERDLAGQALGARSGQATTYTCPECGGTLWEIERLGVTRFHCHTGHVYSADSLLEHQAEELEAALWSSVRRLTEKATLTREMARRQYAAGNAAMAGRFEEQAVLDERHSNLIRQLILGPLSPVDERPADIAGGRAG